jgi:hypothetical protein
MSDFDDDPTKMVPNHFNLIDRLIRAQRLVSDIEQTLFKELVTQHQPQATGYDAVEGEVKAQSNRTSLRDLDLRVVWLFGMRYKLSKQETKFLQALRQALHHALSKERLKNAVGSLSIRFKPRDLFKRHLAVYEYFVCYIEDEYQLQHAECL